MMVETIPMVASGRTPRWRPIQWMRRPAVRVGGDSAEVGVEAGFLAAWSETAL